MALELTALAAIPGERARLDEAELALIDQARQGGASWADIAAALGLASRQAAEQRRLRLATAASQRQQRGLGETYVGALREAAADLERRTSADRRWDVRFPRAALVRLTLATAPTAPDGGLFSLVEAALSDLSTITEDLPQPTRKAVARLAAAFEEATPTTATSIHPGTGRPTAGSEEATPTRTDGEATTAG